MENNSVPVLSEAEFRAFILSSPQDTKVDGQATYPPEFDDLYSLYTKVRNESSVAVLEFGSGWSTLALAKALDENRQLHSRFVSENIRHPNPFCLMTVDVSSRFQEVAIKRIPAHLLKGSIKPVISEVRMTTVNGQACHLFDSIPPFTADFVYLDGPDCDQVQGEINGMSVRFGSGGGTATGSQWQLI